jgi:fumarylacetoacetase
LQNFAAHGGFAKISIELSVFSKPTLNAFAELGRPVHRRVRKCLQDVFSQDTPYPEILKNNAGLLESCIIRQTDVTMHMPMEIGDYTDFFAGKHFG